jgi:hypothetical protein
MSAGIGPKIFRLEGQELLNMMNANLESLKTVIDQIDNQAELEDNEDLKASLKRWRAKFARDAVHTDILLSHVKPRDVHMMTGTEMLGVFNTFRTVHVNMSYLRLNPPPPDGELAEVRQAATAAAIPRAAGNIAGGVDLLWTPGVGKGILRP